MKLFLLALIAATLSCASVVPVQLTRQMGVDSASGLMTSLTVPIYIDITLLEMTQRGPVTCAEMNEMLRLVLRNDVDINIIGAIDSPQAPPPLSMPSDSSLIYDPSDFSASPSKSVESSSSSSSHGG